MRLSVGGRVKGAARVRRRKDREAGSQALEKEEDAHDCKITGGDTSTVEVAVLGSERAAGPQEYETK